MFLSFGGGSNRLVFIVRLSDNMLSCRYEFLHLGRTQSRYRGLSQRNGSFGPFLFLSFSIFVVIGFLRGLLSIHLSPEDVILRKVRFLGKL
jgi:hypothetical protein